jgi:hypothetical protein
MGERTSFQVTRSAGSIRSATRHIRSGVAQLSMVIRLPCCGILARNADIPSRSPDNVAPCALHIHRRRPDKFRRRCRRSVRQIPNRSPSSVLQSRIRWRRRDPVRCNAPSFLHPAHASIPSRNVRTRSRNRYMPQYSFDIFRVAYSAK